MSVKSDLTRDVELQAGGPSAAETVSPQGHALSEARGPSNPAMQLVQWVGSFAVPGIGMFMEAYFIFSVGNVKPIWAEQYPACWKVRPVKMTAQSLHTSPSRSILSSHLGSMLKQLIEASC